VPQDAAHRGAGAAGTDDDQVGGGLGQHRLRRGRRGPQRHPRPAEAAPQSTDGVRERRIRLFQRQRRRPVRVRRRGVGRVGAQDDQA
jgi:hypothetical protein